MFSIEAQSSELLYAFRLRTPQNATTGSCGDAPDWALRLDGQPDSTRYFTLSNGYLETYADGRIRLWARFVNYSASFPTLAIDMSFYSVTEWQNWQASNSPYEYLSFCGSAADREQWNFLEPHEGAIYLYNSYGYYNETFFYSGFNVAPMQNDDVVWAQLGLGAHGIMGEEGLAMEFGYNGSWNMNGLDYALLQGIGRIALELETLYTLPSTVNIEAVDNSFILDCERTAIQVYDDESRDYINGRYWQRRITYWWGDYWQIIDQDSSVVIGEAGDYRYEITTPMGYSLYDYFSVTVDSSRFLAVRRFRRLFRLALRIFLVVRILQRLVTTSTLSKQFSAVTALFNFGCVFKTIVCAV